MKITSLRHETGFRLSLVGDLVKESVPQFREEVSKLDTEPSGTLYLDMAEVSYIDSCGLGALILVHKTWKKRGEATCLVNLSPRVKKFFSTTGLLGHFQCVESHGVESERVDSTDVHARDAESKGESERDLERSH